MIVSARSSICKSFNPLTKFIDSNAIVKAGDIIAVRAGTPVYNVMVVDENFGQISECHVLGILNK